ncbi:alpha/beta fold hydrolase [Microbispora cellulosiformans]|uniref:Alpha/beta fold hydrolase n=1 Tax=Microbispora cellulosiformans TaxID=2614688 RepID=A0A5J5K631_9ACTN|nr:alpha/beta fold hydrolase [Microbispora cellulosiformans]KAA9379952.1 alpha/beta fold hydrolase [Microbispora cellulosiformans]
MPMIFLRRAGGVLMILVALVAAVVAALAAFFCAAFATALVPVLVAAALVAFFATFFLSCWAGLALFGLQRSQRPAALAAAVATVVFGAAAGVPLFRPMPRPVGPPPGSDVRFWDLPTGSRIAYSHIPAVGRPRPAPVVFLHGGPGTANDGISPAGRALAADGFDVYAYDQLGSGRSTRLSDIRGYTVARQVADLDAIRRRLGADKIILIGQSWGGELAGHYLAAHPEHVAKAVLSSPGVLWYGAFRERASGELWDRLSPRQRERAESLASSPRMSAAQLLAEVNPSAAHALLGDDEADELFRRILEASVSAAQCPGRPPASLPANRPGFYVNQMTIADARTLPDPRPRLRTVTIPTLVMRGECDYKDWQVTYDYRRTLPDSTLVYVPHAGHAIAMDQPAVYLAVVRAYLLGHRLPLPPYTAATPPT